MRLPRPHWHRDCQLAKSFASGGRSLDRSAQMQTENSAISKSKIAIVTGGSRGLGRSTVLSLAKRGVGSIFTYNSNLAEAEKVSALAAQSEVKAVAVQLNTGHISAFDGFVKRAREIL